MSAQLPPPVPPASWAQVLERIEQSLAEAVRRSEEREQSLQASPETAPPAGPDVLARLDETVAAFGRCVDRAAARAAEADAVLAEAADGLGAWLRRAALYHER